MKKKKKGKSCVGKGVMMPCVKFQYLQTLSDGFSYLPLTSSRNQPFFYPRCKCNDQGKPLKCLVNSACFESRVVLCQERTDRADRQAHDTAVVRMTEYIIGCRTRYMRKTEVQY